MCGGSSRPWRVPRTPCQHVSEHTVSCCPLGHLLPMTQGSLALPEPFGRPEIQLQIYLTSGDSLCAKQHAKIKGRNQRQGHKPKTRIQTKAQEPRQSQGSKPKPKIQTKAQDPRQRQGSKTKPTIQDKAQEPRQSPRLKPSVM